MQKDKRAFSLQVPIEVVDKVNRIKKEDYFDKSYSKLWNDLIAIGVEQYYKQHDMEMRK